MKHKRSTPVRKDFQTKKSHLPYSHEADSETLFRTLVETSSDWIWVINKDGVYTYSSPKVIDILGHTPEEIIGKTPFDLMPSEEAERVAKKFIPIAQTQQAFSNLENINQHKDGRLITLETSGVPVFDEQGEFCGYRGIDRDISQRKQSEAALQASEQHYRWLVESANAIPWEVDLPSWRFTYVGPQAEAILGYPPEEWYEEGFWLKHMHADDLSWAPEFCQASTGRREDHDFEYRMYAKDGSLKWIRDTVNIIVDDDKPSMLRGFMFDITAQKQKQEALILSQQRLLESQRIARLGHWEWNIQDNSFYWSDEVYRILGYQPQQFKATYDAFLDAVHPDERTQVEHALSEAHYDNNYSIDHRIQLPNGDIRSVHEQAEVHYDDAGKPIQMLGTIQDISERKHLENALNTIANFISFDDFATYCRTCAENLANIYDSSYVLIGLFSDSSYKSIQTQAVWAQGKLAENFEYKLEGTPCFDVLDMTKELVPRDAAKLYPEDTLLAEMGVESYFGAPLLTDAGKKLGIIAILDIKPAEITPWTEPVLGIFAQRIASFVQQKDSSEKIKSSEKELSDIFRNIQDTYYRTDKEGIITRLSESVSQLLGYEVDELLGTNIKHIYLDTDKHHQLNELMKIENGSVENFEAPLKHKNGSTVWASTHAHYNKNAAGKILGIEGMTRNITKHREAELQMKKMSSALEQSDDMVLITDVSGIVEYVNPAFEANTGYSKDEIIGSRPDKLKSGMQNLLFYKNMWKTILQGEAFRDIFVNKKKDGSLYYEDKAITPIKNTQGEITHFVATGHDITKRIENEERLSFMAHHDALTELPNRTLFMDRLKQSLAHALRHTKKVAVLFIDLDRFKIINDTLGHDTGDQLLTRLAERLNQCIRHEDTVARLGGDEFAILLTDIETEQDVSQLAQMILHQLEKPFDIENRELFITASIGISLFPNDGDESGILLKNADIAMYKAKDLGKNNFQFYSVDMSSRAFQRLSMENSLRRALEREEFRLFYQPQIDTKTNTISGAEALIRWQHPDLGMVSPDDFIPLLEETGLIDQVGFWVIETASKQMQEWHKAGFPQLMMSINISGRQFHDKDFIKKIKTLIDANSIPAELLEMEITESVLMENQQHAITALESLGKLGCNIAIDDFGTGYSSLSYLRRFNIDVLKVDQSFVRDVIDDADDAAITSAIIAMANSLNLKVIAEGVETQAQLNFLNQHHCRFVQGYFFSRPLPADEFTQLLNTQQHTFSQLTNKK